MRIQQYFLPLLFYCVTPAQSWAPSTIKSVPTTTRLYSGDFEYQELKVQLDSIKKAQVAFQDLQPLKIIEVVDYCKKVANKKSTLPVNLSNSKWRLAFSTDSSVQALPRDASVYLEFGSKDDKLNYILQFSPKTFGLERLTAESTFTVNDQGHVSYTYDRVTTDAFGMNNIGVGLFGMLQGRTTNIYTAFFDGSIWIELGYDGQGKEYASVYVREGDEW